MSGLPWYKRDPDAFIEGCRNSHLTLEEIGAYAILIDEMYRRGRPLIDDPKHGCAVLQCDARVWKRLRGSLIRKGKIYATTGGHLSNLRVEKELQRQYDLREQKARSGRLSAQLRDSYAIANQKQSPNSNAKSLSSKENARTQPPTPPPLDIDIDIEEVKVGSASEPTSIDQPVAMAMEAYNEAASKAGWIKARLPIGAQRRRQVRTALKALNGIDGWRELIATAEEQPFLSGSNDRGWRMDLEFFASERGRTRILERKYARSNGIDETERQRRQWVFETHGVWQSDWGPRPASQAKGGIRD